MRIDIIGRGNVATHLYKAFGGKADVNIVNPRTLENIRKEADIYLVSVSDDAIQEVVSNVVKNVSQKAIIAHTSGTTALDSIRPLHERTGVFYPLQTFSKDVALDYGEIPFFIEGSDEQVCESLEDAARLVSRHVQQIDSDRRRDLHIASVFSCNFVNHLWTLADSYLREKGIGFEAMVPLINETVRKISRVSPYQAQTGPAVRHDTKTMESHCQRLKDNSEMLDIYNLLTSSIISHHPLDEK